jgi:hypothetical protein
MLPAELRRWYRTRPLAAETYRSLVLITETLRVDFGNAPPGQRRKLLDNRAVDQNPQAAAACRSMFQRAPVDHHLGGPIRDGVNSSSKRHSGTCPRRFQVRHVLDADRDSHQCVGALAADAIDRRLHCITEELQLAARRRGSRHSGSDRSSERQRPSQAPSVPIPTTCRHGGHLSSDTASGHACRLPPW